MKNDADKRRLATAEAEAAQARADAAEQNEKAARKAAACTARSSAHASCLKNRKATTDRGRFRQLLMPGSLTTTLVLAGQNRLATIEALWTGLEDV